MAQQTRKAKKQPAKSGMKPFYYALGGIAVVGGVLIAMSAFKGKPASEPIAVNLPPAELVQAAQGIRKGPENAPVKVLVFADYTCPSCARHALEFGPIMEELLKSGKIQEVFYDFPLGGTGEHKHSFLAARAGRCANEQQKFWEYHDLLFAKQRDWAYNPERQPTDDLITYSGEAGLDSKAFEQCLRSDKYADVVSASEALGRELGVHSTPTIIMNSRIPVWNSWDELRDAIKKEAGIL